MGKLRSVWAGVTRFFAVLWEGGDGPAMKQFREDWAKRYAEQVAVEADDGVVGVYDQFGNPVPRTKPERVLTGIPHGIVEQRIEVPRPGREMSPMSGAGRSKRRHRTDVRLVRLLHAGQSFFYFPQL